MSNIQVLGPSSTSRAAEGNPARKPPAAALLLTQEAAEFLSLKPKTLAKDRCTREIGVPFVKFGRSVRYRLSDLEKFVADRVVA